MILEYPAALWCLELGKCCFSFVYGTMFRRCRCSTRRFFKVQLESLRGLLLNSIKKREHLFNGGGISSTVRGSRTILNSLRSYNNIMLIVMCEKVKKKETAFKSIFVVCKMNDRPQQFVVDANCESLFP